MKKSIILALIAACSSAPKAECPVNVVREVAAPLLTCTGDCDCPPLIHHAFVAGSEGVQAAETQSYLEDNGFVCIYDEASRECGLRADLTCSSEFVRFSAVWEFDGEVATVGYETFVGGVVQSGCLYEGPIDAD